MAKQNGNPLKGRNKEHYERLTDLREELVEELKIHTDSSLAMEREAGGDVADIGTDNFMRDVGLGLMTEEGKRLQLIEDAINRLHEGTYGICMDCENEIQSGRLEALPYAKLCVKCKSVREQREAQGYFDDEDQELTE